MTIQAVRDRAAKLAADVSIKRSSIFTYNALMRAVEALTRFFLAMLLSRAYIFGGHAPFGTAMVAASGAGFAGFFSMAGAVAGSLIGSSLTDGLRHAAPTFLVYAAVCIFNPLPISQKTWFIPALAALMSACTGFVYLIADSFAPAAVIFFTTNLVLIGGCSYFYRLAFDPWTGSLFGLGDAEVRHTLSLLILIMSLCLSLAGTELPLGISLGRLMAFVLVMLSAYLGGLGIGCVTGVCAGIAIDAALGGLPVCTAVFAFTGLVTGVFSRAGKLFFILAMLTTVTVAAMWVLSYTSYDGLLAETLLGALILLFLPSGVMARLSAYYRPRGVISSQRIREQASRRLENAAVGFLALSDAVREAVIISDERLELASVFRSTAARVCRSCPMSGSCWDRCFDRTQDALEEAAERMTERGRLEPGDFPEDFRGLCTHFEEFAAAASEEYRTLLYRRQFAGRMREAQSIICTQYSCIHALLAECSEELLSEVSVLPGHQRLSAAVGIASVRRRGEGVNGDSGSYFRTPDGKLCIVLSDGMGTGQAAAEESGAAVKILESLLGSGIAPGTALKLFNASMQFKNGEQPSCATVDLLCTDLTNGQAALYKYGAAPTYVKRGRAVTRITSRAFAAGLSPDAASEPDLATMNLAAGDFAIIASDGVACATDDEWLRRLAADWDEADPRGLSRAILQAAVDKYGRVDDMTVAVMHLGERGK